MDVLIIISIIADILGIIGFVKSSKMEIDEWIKIIKPPKEVNFYFLTFWSLVASILGGLIWNVLNSINEKYPFMGTSVYVGGTLEPHGLAVIIWSLVTTIPLTITLLVLNRKYHFSSYREQLRLYLLFTTGITTGSLVFYDLPVLGYRGFRNYYQVQIMHPYLKELALVIIWSSLLSVIGFLFMALWRIKTASTEKNARTKVITSFLKQSGLCIGITTLAVMFCVLVFPNQPRFETARGVIAGLALRTTLFFGLLLGIGRTISIHPKKRKDRVGASQANIVQG